MTKIPLKSKKFKAVYEGCSCPFVFLNTIKNHLYPWDQEKNKASMKGNYHPFHRGFFFYFKIHGGHFGLFTLNNRFLNSKSISLALFAPTRGRC